MNLIDILTQPFKHSQAFMSDEFERRYFPQLLDLRPTKTGKLYAVEDLLQNSTVWKCCQVRMNSVAVLPKYLYRDKGEARELVKKSDPRQRLLRRPNPQHTRFDLDSYLQLQKLMYGTAFAQQIVDENFRVAQHWPLASKFMSVAKDDDLNLLVWKYRDPKTAKDRIFAPWELHIRRGPSLDGVLGLSVFDLAFNSFALGMGLEEYCARIFENDSTPRGVLLAKGKLDKESKDNIREEWERKYGGLANRGKIGILDYELDFKPIGMSNDVAQFLESRKFQREEVANWFNVPQHMAGILERSTNNNIEQQSKEFIRDTLNPELTGIEQEYNRDILWTREQDDLFVEYEVERLQRGDFGDQTDRFTKEIAAGIKSLNEVRKWYNLPPVEGGDEHLRQSAFTTWEDPEPDPSAESAQNEAPDDEKISPKTPEKAPKTDKKEQKQANFSHFKPLFRDAWSRIIKRDCLALERELKKTQSVERVYKWAERWQEEQVEFAQEVLKPIFETISEAGLLLSAQTKEALIGVVNYHAGHRLQEIRACSDLSEIGETRLMWLEDKVTDNTASTLLMLEDFANE